MTMFRKALITAIVFVAAGAFLLVAGSAASGTSLPQRITAESACPATGCASGLCHGYGDVPQPDGVHEMTCPESGCSSVDCHAWPALSGSYRQARDASMNLWILFPVLFAAALIGFVLRAKGRS